MRQNTAERGSWARAARSTQRTMQGAARAGIPTLILMLLGFPLIAGCVPSSCGTHSLSALAGVYAVSASDVWAVGGVTAGRSGQAGLIEHWDGTRWAVAATSEASPGGADFPPSALALSAVAGSGADDVWAVGSSGARSHGPVVMHWNGATWQAGVAPCYVSCVSSRLNAIAVLSATDAWAVGVADIPGGSDPADHPLVEHWDGSKWQIAPGSDSLSTDAALTSVVAFSATDVWVFGAEQHYYAFIAHWNGTAWRVAAGASAPAEQLPLVDYNTTLGAAVIDPHARTQPIWVVGTTFANPCVDCAQPLILQGISGRWSNVPADQIVTGPAAPPPLAVRLMAVGVVDPSDAWAVGTHQAPNKSERDQAFIAHWDGTRWQDVPAPAQHTLDVLDGVGVVSAADVWAVGSSTNLDSGDYWSHTLVERWNGTSWTIVPSPNPGATVPNACM